MKNVWLLAQNILRVTFRRKSSYFVYIVMPVLVVLLSFSLTALPSGAVKVGVANEDRGALGAEVLTMLAGNRDITISQADSKDMNALIQGKTIDCGLVIPQDFTQSLSTANPAGISVVATGDQQKSMPLLEGILNVSVQNLKDLTVASSGDKAKFDKLFAAYQAGAVRVDTVVAQDEAKSRNATANAVGFFIMFLLYGTSIVSNLILNEKSTRTYFRIVCAPVNSRQFLLANLLTNLLIVAAQIALVVFVTITLLHVQLFMPVWQFVAVLLCFGFASIGIGFLIVSFSRDSAQANTLQTLIIVPTSLLAGCFWPTSIMPDFMQKLAYLMPQHWAIMAIQTLQQGHGFAGVLPDMAVILAFALAFFLVAMYRFSRSQDMQTVA